MYLIPSHMRFYQMNKLISKQTKAQIAKLSKKSSNEIAEIQS